MRKLIILLALFFCSSAFAISLTSKSTTIKITAAPAPGDFAARCSATGVIKCVSFDTDADFNRGSRTRDGGRGYPSGIFPPSDTTDFTKSVRDISVKASGASSLKFIIPPNTGSDTSGSWFTNFSDDYSITFGENQEFFVQWRQRFSSDYITNKFDSDGWKQTIIGEADTPGCSTSDFTNCATSCTMPTIVTQNIYFRGFPAMYNSCGVSSYHGPYYNFEEPVNGGSDFKLQNARPAPYCLYTQQNTSYFPPVGNCFGYFANEWMTFQVQVKVGPRSGDGWINSNVKLWMAREGKPSEPVIDFNLVLNAGSPELNIRYGKVWFLPYQSKKVPDASKSESYTWYDDLIISRNKIADPK